LSLVFRKELSSELSRFQWLTSILEVDTDPMRRRPRAEKTETA
jgi:hypothetical protein